MDLNSTLFKDCLKATIEDYEKSLIRPSNLNLVLGVPENKHLPKCYLQPDKLIAEYQRIQQNKSKHKKYLQTLITTLVARAAGIYKLKLNCYDALSDNNL